MYLQQMPMSWLEMILVNNPGVQVFPGLSSFQDAAVSGVTIPNPNATNANNMNPNVAAIPVVTRAQILTAFYNLAAPSAAQSPSIRTRLGDVLNKDTNLQDIYDAGGPASNNTGGYAITQVI
jgi:hypothetical protein